MTTIHLKTPLSKDDVSKLRIMDVVYLTGALFTARDEAHKRAVEWAVKGKKFPFKTKNLALYHCGPVVKKKKDEWEVVAAGPTTSARMEMLEPLFIDLYGIKMIIGKGGMGKDTTDALIKYGAVYAAYTGGAAVLAAKTITRVKQVEWLDLGTPEALWLFEVRDFGPMIIAIDSTGQSIYNQVKQETSNRLKLVYERLDLQETNK
ncbi:MAG: fumarate hydratase C-terminal domain-containing protein [Candidatus Lokiarchaeota archaeon]|nr:fumarate hydratase C-terminal domain-containing protein [Candidatus Lokiarchaeota archaeon]